MYRSGHPVLDLFAVVPFSPGVLLAEVLVHVLVLVSVVLAVLCRELPDAVVPSDLAWEDPSLDREHPSEAPPDLCPGARPAASPDCPPLLGPGSRSEIRPGGQDPFPRTVPGRER